MTDTLQRSATRDRLSVVRTDDVAVLMPDEVSRRRTLTIGTGYRRPDIQGLRAVAVTLVVLYHSHVPGIRAGYVGVDVFFVISGYLITGQIMREIERTGSLDLVGFYARRMRRLFPLALFVVVVTVVAARLWGPVLQLKATAIDALFTAGYAINFRFASEGVNYQHTSGPVSPMQHFWSLAVEEQFYIVWPILILATLLVARRLSRVLLGVVALAAVAASLAASIAVTAHSAPTAYFSVQTRAWEFGFGALVAIGATQLGRIPQVLRAPATWLGLFFILASAVRYDDNTPFPGRAALVPVIGCALVIAGGCGSGQWRGPGRLLCRGSFQVVGKLSYGWYLWHWPMLVLAPAVLGRDLSWIRQVEISVLALWLAGITHLVIEYPTQHGHFRTRPWMVGGIALSGLAACVAGVVVVTAPGVAGSGRYATALDLRDPGSVNLTTALTEAAREPAVPGNLTPTLSRAAQDVPMTESGCHLGVLQVAEGLCVFGDPAGTRTVVLFGDSHAQQWDGALDSAAKQLHWKLVSWTKAACPVADINIVNPQLKRQYTECDRWRAQTIARINALHPAVVVASQSDSVPGRAVTNGQWVAETVSTLRSLSQPGTRVVFLADTPDPKGDVPSCVAASLSDVRNCDVSRAAAYHGSALYTSRHQLVVKTLQLANIEVVDPIDWLCSKTACPVIVGNALVYRDDSHITNTYSTLLGPVLQPLLAPPASAAPKGVLT